MEASLRSVTKKFISLAILQFFIFGCSTSEKRQIASEPNALRIQLISAEPSSHNLFLLLTPSTNGQQIEISKGGPPEGYVYDAGPGFHITPDVYIPSCTVQNVFVNSELNNTADAPQVIDLKHEGTLVVGGLPSPGAKSGYRIQNRKDGKIIYMVPTGINPHADSDNVKFDQPSPCQ